MGDKENGFHGGDVSNAEIMRSIGELTGTVQALHQGLTARIEDMRDDIRRLDKASNDRMNRIEDNLTDKIKDQGDGINKRIDDLELNVGDKIKALGNRVTALENEDKKIIEKVAKISSLGGALAAGMIELIKHIPH